MKLIAKLQKINCDSKLRLLDLLLKGINGRDNNIIIDKNIIVAPINLLGIDLNIA